MPADQSLALQRQRRHPRIARHFQGIDDAQPQSRGDRFDHRLAAVQLQRRAQFQALLAAGLLEGAAGQGGGFALQQHFAAQFLQAHLLPRTDPGMARRQQQAQARLADGLQTQAGALAHIADHRQIHPLAIQRGEGFLGIAQAQVDGHAGMALAHPRQ
ncbi:hypothetical protein D3C76_1424930 [compost metagenome]